MAHPVEPMDIDSDFDNKENSYHHSNVLPCTEKGYEELDVSELNMKLRYSVTPASSPMSKSYTANCLDNRSYESGDDSLNVTINENTNLTRSLNANFKNDNALKSLKALPLQSIPTEQFSESRSSVLRPLDSTIIKDDANVTVTIHGPNDIDENLSLPSSSSSAVHTPEATTPTKEIPKGDGGSPIMRGLKSMLNMFRSSQSPIPPSENGSAAIQDILNSSEAVKTEEKAMASTPISAHRMKGTSPSKRNSPHKESITFNDDLEKELQWKDETTILFSQERIPIHKLFFQQAQPQPPKKNEKPVNEEAVQQTDDNLDSTVEYMDVSYNDTTLKDKTITDIKFEGKLNKTECNACVESDSEFVDCETTITKDDKEFDLTLDKDKNENSSNLKPVILNTTQDILDATLSITPEDLKTEALDSTKIISAIAPEHEKSKDDISDKSNETKGVTTKDNVKCAKAVDQTLEINNQTMSLIATEINNLDVTKTIDNIDVKIQDPSTPKTTENLNVTFEAKLENTPLHLDASKNIDVYETIGNAPNENNLNITHNLESKDFENKTSQLDLTKSFIGTLELTNLNPENRNIIEQSTKLDTPKIIDSTNIDEERVTNQFNVEHMEPILLKNDSTNITFAIEAAENLNITQNISNYCNIKNNTNSNMPAVEIHIDDQASNIEDHSNIPILENNNLITEHELVIEHYEVNITDDVVDTTNNKVATVENVKPVCNDDKSFDLPADIPLPDEADIEKELPIPVYSSSENIAPVNLLSNNEHSIKINSENIVSSVVVDDKSVLSEVLLTKEETNEKPNVEIPTTVPLQKVIADPTKTVSPSNEKEHLNHINILIQNKLNNEKDEPDSCTLLKEDTNSLDISSSVVETQQTSSVTDMPDPINNAETIFEFKQLPDVINQTIPNCGDNNTEQIVNTTGLDEKGGGLNIATDIIEQNEIAEDHPNQIGITPLVVEKSESEVNEVLSTVQTNAINEDSAKDIDCKLKHVNDLHGYKMVLMDETTNIVREKETVKVDAKVIDEEIVDSENNSPFVSYVLSEHETKTEDLNNIKNSCEINTRIVVTPPASPPIASKGYNFNFDELDDPFATKMKIRTSPTFNTPTKNTVPEISERKIEKPIPRKMVNNRRRSQLDKKRPTAPKSKCNSTFNSGSTDIDESAKKSETDMSTITPFLEKNQIEPLSSEDKEVQDIIHTAKQNIEQKFQEALKLESQNKYGDNSEKQIEIAEKQSSTNYETETKTTSSSEQSTYFSAGTSSSESIKSRNVFNLPEIDDMNFNPFATKSKMCQSPPLNKDTDNPFTTRSKIVSSPELARNVPFNDEPKILCDDKMETEPMEKDSSSNVSNITSSSKATDERDATIREVNTEDEDTVEGPFLEAEVDVKINDLDTESDMINFEPPAPQEEEKQEADEMFIDAEAFEFLLNQNKSNIVVDSGKESLFLKFDPLFANRTTSDGVLAALAKLQMRQSTPTKLTRPTRLPPKDAFSPVPGPSKINITREMDMSTSEELNDDLNVTVSKPMMVVPPAVNPVTPRNKSVTPPRPSRRSVTFTSPAMAVIDRLLSLSANNSMQDVHYTQVLREQNEADLALGQLRELLAEKEVHVYNLRSESKDLRDRLLTMESQVKSLEAESQERLKKINDLTDRLVEKTKINKSMAAVVEEYERTIASLIAETEQDKKRHAEERMRLINERDEQTAHLASMEVSFSDLHSKYEKSKQVILSCKANEDAFKKSIKSFEENLTKMQSNYELLKQHATSKLNHANQELEKMNKAHEAEILKLNAMIKRKELHITSLEESLIQKTKANKELTAICDELINKVG